MARYCRTFFLGRLTMMRCGSLLLALVITLTSLGAAAQQQPATAPPPATPPAVSPAPAQPDQSLLKPEQIEALVAPIALGLTRSGNAISSDP
jgi:hypothetical protein